MFDIGWSELVVIGVVALIVIGPKELPSVLRAIGQWTGKIRRMASEFQGQFHEAMREIETSDLKKQVDEASSVLDTKFNPLDLNDSSWKPDTPSTPPSSASAEAATPPSGTPEPPAAEPAAAEPPAAEPAATPREPEPATVETAVPGEGSRPA
jgi:sec-independent protein translocase protein TatB